MSEEPKILNRGLDALLGSKSNPPTKTVKEIEINKIEAGRFQPRSDFNEEKLSELTDSIKKHGVLSPILVRELGLNKFEVIAGRGGCAPVRLPASPQSLVWLTKKDQDALESALIENLQREDLNAVEEARGYDRLKREFGLTQDEVATATGKARSTIANSLRLLQLSPSILDLLSTGQIEKGHAKILVGMSAKEAEQAANDIVKNKLTIKDISPKKTKPKNQTKTKTRDLLNIEEEMSVAFGHKVEIETKTKSTGKVSISYKTKDELENIISKIIN